MCTDVCFLLARYGPYPILALVYTSECRALAQPSLLPHLAHINAEECFSLACPDPTLASVILLPKRSCGLAQEFSKFPQLARSQLWIYVHWQVLWPCFARSVLSPGICMCQQVLHPVPTWYPLNSGS